MESWYLEGLNIVEVYINIIYRGGEGENQIYIHLTFFESVPIAFHIIDMILEASENPIWLS